MPKITFLPENETIPCGEGETVFAVGRRNQIAIATACAGKGTCGLCRVKLVQGEENVSPINRIEVKHLGNTYFITKLRLSCQTTVTGDVTVSVPATVARK